MSSKKTKTALRKHKLVNILLFTGAAVVLLGLGFVTYIAYELTTNGTDWMPTTKKFQMHDKEKIDAAGILAKKEDGNQLNALGYNLNAADKKSSADLCYRTTRDSGFDTIRYTKTCNLRLTAIFTSAKPYETAFQNKLTNTQNIMHDSVYQNCSPPCNGFTAHRLQTNISLDVTVCPRTADLPKLLNYHVPYDNEKYQNATFEIRGPLDSRVGIEVQNLQLNYALNSFNFYDFKSALNKYADSSAGSIIIVGITNEYYTDDVN